MDRKIMINEIVAAKEKMFAEDPKGNPFTRKNVSGYNTSRLEKLHIKTMEEYRVWSLNEEERNRSASILKNQGPDTLLAVQAGILPEEEKKMAKDKKKKEKAPEVPKFAADDRSAFEALAVACWEEDDRPDISEMTDDQVSQELKESLGLLAPEDKETILALENGKANWAYLEDLMKDQAEEKVEVKKKEKAPKEKKPPKEKKEKVPAIPKYTRSEAFADALRKSPTSVKELITSSDKLYASQGGKSNDKEAKWMAGYAFKLLSAMNLIKVAGDKIENIADCILTN